MRVEWMDGADLEAMREIYRPIVEETVISFEEVVPTAEEWATRVAAVTATHPWLVAREGGACVGYAYAAPHRARAAYRWSVESSVYVASTKRGRGVGRALSQALLRLLREQGFESVYAGITLPNDASVRLHESLGFESAGVFRRVGFKRGRWCDVGWWQRRLGGDEAPREPRPIDALRQQFHDITSLLETG